MKIFHYVKISVSIRAAERVIQSSVCKCWAGRHDQKVLLSFHMGYIRTGQKQRRVGERG